MKLSSVFSQSNITVAPSKITPPSIFDLRPPPPSLPIPTLQKLYQSKDEQSEIDRNIHLLPECISLCQLFLP